MSEFDRQGYIILKQFIEPQLLNQAIDEMKKLVDLCAEKLIAAGKITDPLKSEPFDTRLYSLYKGCIHMAPKSFRKELHMEGLFSLFFHSRLLDAVELYLGNEIRLYPNYTARPKFPEWEGTQVLWHQDGGYTEKVDSNSDLSVDSLRMVNVWMPLVSAYPENGCMQFIPGSHKLGVVPHEVKEHYLQITSDYLEPLLDQAVDVVVDPGDIVLFHNLLFHQGQPNLSGTIRWSLDWRYQDATQPTHRRDHGHIARSRLHPASAVQSAEQWAQLAFR